MSFSTRNLKLIIVCFVVLLVSSVVTVLILLFATSDYRYYAINTKFRKVYAMNFTNETEDVNVKIDSRSLFKRILDKDLVYGLSAGIVPSEEAVKNDYGIVWKVNIHLVDNNDQILNKPLFKRVRLVDPKTNKPFEYAGFTFDKTTNRIELYMFVDKRFFNELSNLERSIVMEKLFNHFLFVFEDTTDDEFIHMIQGSDYNHVFLIAD